jgi:uncharacterized protein YqeY
MERNIIARMIQGDLKKAVKEKDRVRINTLRMLISTLKNVELEEREELTEDKEIAVLAGYVKRCRESIRGFEQGGRTDLVEKEKAELDIVFQYLPEQMGEEEIREMARNIIEEVGASSLRDMGRVMGEMMKRVRGRADGGVVKNIVMELLKEV